MNFETRLFWVVAVVVFQFAYSGVGIAGAPLTAGELMKSESLKAHLSELENGEIVLANRPETEKGNELNVIMAIVVPAPLNQAVDALQRQALSEDSQGILAAGPIAASTGSELKKAFAAVTFTSDEKQEVEKMMKIEAGGDFNFSADEILLLKQKAKDAGGGALDGPAAVEAMAEAMRSILTGRYLSYFEKGLQGLAPYQFGENEQVNPSDELIAATETLHLVKERFPGYYRYLRSYPEVKDPQIAHQFFWAKQKESGRPMFVLKHWIVDIRPDYALITERRYYLSHSLNSLQVVIGCLPHGNRTLVVLLNQTFTEKVNMTVGRKIAKTIGYKQVEKNIRPMFEGLRTELGR